MDPNFNAEAFSLLGISLGVIGFRFASRLLYLGFRGLAPDDYLMVLAGCLYSAETVAAYYVQVYRGFTIAPMTDEERYQLSLTPSSQEYRDRVDGSKTQLMGWIVYTCLLWTLKSCMLFFYSRLTENVDKMNVRIRFGAYLLGATFLALICVILFGCHPVQNHWQVYPDPGPVCYPAHSYPSLYTLITLNVSTDIYLMFIPLPMIWKSGLSRKVKIGLFAMFTGGIFATTAGFLRCILIITGGAESAIQAGQWSCRESFIAVLVSNLPLIYPFLSRWYHQINSNSFGSQPTRPKSFPLNTFGSGGRAIGKKKHGPYSIPGMSILDNTNWDRTNNGEQLWNSSERIYIPAHKVDIETGSETDVHGKAFMDSRGQKISVHTEIGVRSPDKIES